MKGELLVPRWYGSEIEFGISIKTGDENKSINSSIPPYMREIGGFLNNGGRLYLDYNNFPEYATPECRNLSEVVLHEIAGEGIANDAYVRKEVSSDESFVLHLHKRTITPDGQHSTGSHESYSTTVDIWQGGEKLYMSEVLAAHNATRTLFTGAGQPLGSDYDKDNYALAQKMLTVVDFKSQATTAKKPLINTRSEHHAGDSKSPYKRFHNTCGDANISPWVIKMKYGTTSLVLRLLEHEIDMRDVTLSDPVQSASFIAESNENMLKPLRLRNGNYASALDIQRIILDRAITLSEKIQLPADELEVIKDWSDVLENLLIHAQTGDDMNYLKRLDWYTKRQILTGYAMKIGSLAGKEFENVVLGYDQTENGIGIKLRQPGRRFSIDMPTQQEIRFARSTPKEGRPGMRGQFIDAVNGLESPLYATVNWSEIRYNAQLYTLPIDGDYSREAINDKVNKLLKSDFQS